MTNSLENVGRQENLSRPLTVKEWLVTYLILFLSSLIPLLPIIVLLIWAFSDNTALCKKNWAKASLIFYLILIGLVLLFFVIFGAGIMANMPA